MRILIANDTAAGGGGVESYLASIVPALTARGHQLAFLHLNPRREEGPTRIEHAGMPDFSVGDDGLAQAIDRVVQWKPDVCFSHNMRELAVDERLTARWPVVKMMHGYFGTCVSSQKAHAFPHVTPCSRTFGAACLGIYLPRRCGRLRPLQMLAEYGWASRQHALLDRYAHVVVASRHMADEYGRHGVAAERLTAVPLFPTDGVPSSVRPMPAMPTVVFAGRMTRIKGGDVLVRAIAAANRISAAPIGLLMAGDGPARGEWEALSRELRVDATFTGWLTGPARTALLRRASVAAVPSLWPEPFGLVGLEAASHGVPAIAFDVGGIREWLEDDVSGRLVPEVGDYTALGRVISATCSAPPDLQRLGEGASRVARTLSIGVHLDRLEGVLAGAAPATPAVT